MASPSCTARSSCVTLSREVEWKPASIEHFSVPADSTPQPEIVPEVPPAVLPPIDLEGQEAPPTLDQAQRRYPQLDRRPPDYYKLKVRWDECNVIDSKALTMMHLSMPPGTGDAGIRRGFDNI